MLTVRHLKLRPPSIAALHIALQAGPTLHCASLAVSCPCQGCQASPASRVLNLSHASTAPLPAPRRRPRNRALWQGTPQARESHAGRSGGHGAVVARDGQLALLVQQLLQADHAHDQLAELVVAAGHHVTQPAVAAEQ